MARRKAAKVPETLTIDFDNGDGTVDVWKYKKHNGRLRCVETTSNVKRRKKT